MILRSAPFGDVTDLDGKKQLLFDVTTFTDDDGRLHLYYSGRRTDGIYGVELNGTDVTKERQPRECAGPGHKAPLSGLG